MPDDIIIFQRLLLHTQLYLIQALPSRLYKVGISSDYRARLQNLQRENALLLEVVAVWECDATYVEPVVHRFLKARGYHVHHEWFKIPTRRLPGCRSYMTKAAKGIPFYTREDGAVRKPKVYR